jgi:hypothetical protein
MKPSITAAVSLQQYGLTAEEITINLLRFQVVLHVRIVSTYYSWSEGFYFYIPVLTIGALFSLR